MIIDDLNNIYQKRHSNQKMVTKKSINVMFTDFWHPPKFKYLQRNFLYRFLSKHYDFNFSSRPDILFYSCFGHDYLKYDCIRLFYTGENIRPNFEECDYSFSFDFPTNDRNYRLPYYRLSRWYDLAFEPRTSDKTLSNNRKFCCFLVTNPIGHERNYFFKKLSKYKHIDSGGSYQNNVGFRVPPKDTINWMKDYKFCIAFENSKYPGYTTEKLLHALVANTIPIYWGNPIVGKDFNTKAFINGHDYENFDDLIEVIIKIDQSDDLYEKMLMEPVFPWGRETDFCQEDAIIDRFDQIFTNKIVHVSPQQKKIQRRKYPILKTKYMIKIGKAYFWRGRRKIHRIINDMFALNNHE